MTFQTYVLPRVHVQWIVDTALRCIGAGAHGIRPQTNEEAAQMLDIAHKLPVLYEEAVASLVW